jgi:hypothetical protein
MRPDTPESAPEGIPERERLFPLRAMRIDTASGPWVASLAWESWHIRGVGWEARQASPSVMLTVEALKGVGDVDSKNQWLHVGAG